MIVTHFIVSDDVERCRRFYTEVLGGTVAFGPATDPEGDRWHWPPITSGGQSG